MGKLFTEHADGASQPGFAISLITIFLPVVMMLGRTVAKLALTKDTLLYDTLDFVGEPLALTVLFAIVMLGWSRGMARDRVGGILRRSLPPIAALLLTIGAGGGLKQMLVNAGISVTIGKIAVGVHLPLLLVWLMAVALRQATGSGHRRDHDYGGHRRAGRRRAVGDA